jgi:hypothetical protein
LETMARKHIRSAMEQIMNAKGSTNTQTKASKVLQAAGVAAALLLAASSAFAEPHGGGGGGHSFGGGGHASFSHAGAPQGGGSRGFGRPSFSGAAHYSASVGHAQVGVGGRGGYSGAYSRGYGGWHGGGAYGYHATWGGGYWHGGFWPGAYYGWSYPLFLGFLPAVYSTYWWSGVPYYYVNNVYYTYDTSDNGYVATDPPPVSDSYSDDVNAAAAAGPDGGAVNAAPDVAPPAVPGAGIIAYPRNGQSDQQQATDKFQCHNWAKGQTGFDPTSQSSSGAPASARSNYGRAMAACLDARGYTVR